MTCYIRPHNSFSRNNYRHNQIDNSGSSMFYSQSHPSTFTLFPDNNGFISADSTSTLPHARESRYQPPRSMLCTTLGPYSNASFVDESPVSCSGSGFLSNSDGSAPESPVDDLPASDHTHGLNYGHDLFDQQLRAIFTLPTSDSLLYPGSNAAETNLPRYAVKQEHQTVDSYQQFMGSGSQPRSPYSNSHATDNSSEPFEADLGATLLPYEFTGQYNGHPGHTLTSTPLDPGDADNLANVEYVTATESCMRYTGGPTQNGIAQQQNAQLSPHSVPQTNGYSPSPPLYANGELGDARVCDPRFVSGREDDDIRPADVPIQIKIDEEYQMRDGASSASSAVASASSLIYDVSHHSSDMEERDDPKDDEYEDYGESEVEEDLHDDDGEFMLRTSRRPKIKARSKVGTISRLGLSSYSKSPDASDVREEMNLFVRQTRGSSVPVPVPNLTKKSRGRRVPTLSTIVAQGGVQKNGRMYACKVKDCGKCFARGEHLKRHVRSIHTNEKPHKCPFPGCDKDFSRHDNLGQHMRVHKTYLAGQNFA